MKHRKSSIFDAIFKIKSVALLIGKKASCLLQIQLSSMSCVSSVEVVHRDDARLPTAMRVPFIHNGYRLPQFSVFHCLHSGCTAVHNETAAVHTHLWPAVLVALRAMCALTWTLPAVASNWSFAEQLAWHLFFAAAVACFAASTVFHSLLSHHDENVRRTGNQIDYCGIMLLIGHCNLLAFFLGFECFPLWQALHVAVAASLLVVGITLQTWGGWWHPSYRRRRLIVFVASGTYGLLPLAQWAYLTGGRPDTTIVTDILMFFTIFAAAFGFYVSRFPEKMWRNRFTELVLSSHVCWHIGTAAGVLYFIEIVVMFRKYRAMHGCVQELGVQQ